MVILEGWVFLMNEVPLYTQELDALLNKKLENPWKKHGNIPL